MYSYLTEIVDFDQWESRQHRIWHSQSFIKRVILTVFYQGYTTAGIKFCVMYPCDNCDNYFTS